MTLQKIREGEKLLKIILLLIASCLHLMVYASEPVEISGTIVIPQGVRIPDGGLDVVLLKFVVNDQGEITTTGPQARVKSQKDGSFRIPNIPRELRAAFRIGTRVRGRLHQSNVIFMNEEDSVYQVEVLIPGLSEKVEVLELEKASLILERGLGKIRVTEVWEIKNPTSDMVDSVKAGFRINLPDSISDFSMPDEMGQQSTDFSLGENRVEVRRVFPPGSTQLVFQYSVSSFLGQVVMTKTFRDSLEKVMVFTPVGQLEVSSGQLKYKGDQKLHKTAFTSWQGKALDTGKLEIKISEVPVKFLDYSFIILIMLMLLSLCVFMFYQFRLKRTPRQSVKA